MINPKIAGILGMEIPDEDEPSGEVIIVEPHRIVKVENPDLPPTHDIDRKQLQAETELQAIIDDSMRYQKELFKEIETVEPKYRSRYVEVANGTMHIALDAVKVKLKTQEEKKKQRLKDAGFKKPLDTNSPSDTTNNFFFGTRNDLIAAIRDDSDETA